MIDNLIVVDNRKSALGIAARNRFEVSKSKVVYASDFQTPQKLLNELVSHRARSVLFTWRQAFYDLSAIASENDLVEFRKKFPVGILIPDHLGASEKFQKTDDAIIRLVDFYLVTSEALFEIYSLNYPSFPPQGILHDVPNSQLIRQVRSRRHMKVSKKAIWVGNSDWGKRHGFYDHKGLEEVIKPLKQICESHGKCFDIEIIDTKKNYFSQEDLFFKMSESKFILQSSNAEGTGLPILEGMGLGCIPITTDVGIAPEILKGTLGPSIVERNAHSFHKRMHALESDDNCNEENMISRYEEFVEQLSFENFVPQFSEEKTESFSINDTRKFMIYAIWNFRKIRGAC